MNDARRICQNCKTDFTIEPGDFVFYEKIKVPSPMLPIARRSSIASNAIRPRLYK